MALVYHGLDFARVSRAARRRARRATAATRAIPSSCSRSAALVEKKGYDVLIEALALLPPDARLAARPYRRRRSADRTKCAAVPTGRHRVAHRLARRAAAGRGAAPLSRGRPVRAGQPVARDGDRDGLPNVLMEAQSQGLACVATRACRRSPRSIEDGATGLLVPPGDAGALAEALAALIADPTVRRALGRAAEAPGAPRLRP